LNLTVGANDHFGIDVAVLADGAAGSEARSFANLNLIPDSAARAKLRFG
jgi:hypothetical protein